MAESVDIDLYENIEEGFDQDGEFTQDADLYDDVIITASNDADRRRNSSHDEPRKTSVPSSIPPNYTGRRFSVYVGNLTWWTTDQDLSDALNNIGVHDLLEIKFYENRANGQSKGFAIVIVGSESSSRSIFDKLPRRELHGQTPMVTHCNKQSLNNFEAQARKGEAPPQQNGRGRGDNRGESPRGPPAPQQTQQPPPQHNIRPQTPFPPRAPGPPPNMQGPPPQQGPPQRPPTSGPPPNFFPGPPRPGMPPVSAPPVSMAPGAPMMRMTGPPPGMPPRGPPGPDPRGPPPMRPGFDRPPGPDVVVFEQPPPPGTPYPARGPLPPQPVPPPGVRGPGPNMPGMPPQQLPPGVPPPGQHPVAPPAPHVNPAFFPPQHGGPLPPPAMQPFPGNAAPPKGQGQADKVRRGASVSIVHSSSKRTVPLPVHVSAPPTQDPYGRPPPVSYPSAEPYRPPPAERFEPKPRHEPPSPALSEQEFEEIFQRNKTVSSSAISRAVQDASAGDFASAIETLVTAVSLIKQSKIANDDRCKILISSLQDTLHGIEEKSYGSKSRERRSRSRDRDRERDREKRSRHRSRSREREYRERSRERDRREYEDRHRDSSRGERRESERDRDRDREYSRSSRH